MGKLKDNKGLNMFFKIVDMISEGVLFITLGGLFLIVIIQIIGRIIGMPAPWTEEGTRYLFLWMMFVALAYGFKYSESARVSVLVDKLPKSMKKFSGIMYLLSTIGFFIFITVYGIILVTQQVQMNEMGAAIFIPMYLIGLSVPVSGILGVISTVQCLIETPEKIFGGNE